MPNSAENPLGEQLPPLTRHEALVEANRCLYCFDAPCTHACPTHINIPGFIKKIATDNLTGSARTILESNLMGASCARVCPVEELCEGACVLGAEHKPITIGRLQRHAMDYVYEKQVKIFTRAAETGRRVAVIGAGPAGLSCAGELARRGHAVTVFEKRQLGGGLSTYGIIALREPVPVALAEVEMIAGLGVEMREGVEVGRDIPVAELADRFDAVFIGAGLGTTPALGIPGEEHVLDGLEYIEQSKLTPDLLPRAEFVVVIGAGNTAIDCATVARRTGAEQVTMVYRRTVREMTAYPHEYEFVKKEGVGFEFLAQPVAVQIVDGKVRGLECVRAELAGAYASGRPAPRIIPGSNFPIRADCIIKAIGLEAGNEMGPLISAEHRDRVASYVDSAKREGAEVDVDGRKHPVSSGPGFFLGTSLIDRVKPGMRCYDDEIFGPVLSVVRAATYGEALALINGNLYANGVAIFTRDGGAARQFQFDVEAGMVGINVPIPVPVAYYSFGGWKSSLFGDLHMYGPEGVQFYTRAKVVTGRWPDPGSSSVNLGFPQVR